MEPILHARQAQSPLLTDSSNGHAAIQSALGLTEHWLLLCIFLCNCAGTEVGRVLALNAHDLSVAAYWPAHASPVLGLLPLPGT
jgi:hypothetical protein